MVKVVPNPLARPSSITLPTWLGGQTQLAAMRATETGLSPEDQALRDQWDANGDLIESCQEYVYEAYYDYMRFEDYVITRFGDFPLIAQTAFGLGEMAIGTWLPDRLLKAKDGSNMRFQAPVEKGYIVDLDPNDPTTFNCYGESKWVTTAMDNPFFALPRELLKAGEWDQYELWKHRCGKNDIGGAYPYIAPSATEVWAWHRSKRDAVLAAGYSPVELDAMSVKIREFQKLLTANRRYQTAGTPPCCTSEPGGECCTEHQATATSLKTQLRELFDLAVEAGCMEPGATLCSWSPHFFADRLRDSYNASMERDYQSCLDLTSDDFTGLKAYQFQLPDGTAWPPCEPDLTWPGCPVDDYTVSATAMFEFIQRYESWKWAVEEYWRQLAQSMPRDLFDSQGKLHKPGKTWSENYESGGGEFGVFYNYNLYWACPRLIRRRPNRLRPCA